MRSKLLRKALIVGVSALSVLALSVPATATTPDRPGGSAKPTVVLVHGAWADSSSWAPVVERLTRDGYPVRAIANPLQGLTGDSAYLASYLATIEGPKILVGHSYGGAVITNAVTTAPGVKALVYVAGFIPVQGETIGELASRSASSLPLLATQVPGGTEVVIDPAHFRDRFAGDLDRTAAATLAVAQRPANTNAVTDASGAEGFRTIPSFALVTRKDRAIDPSVQRFMATRANAKITEVDASHAVMLSRPDVVTKLIESAAR